MEENNKICLDQEVNNFEEIIYKSVVINDFYNEWLKSFPPMIKRQHAFCI